MNDRPTPETDAKLVELKITERSRHGYKLDKLAAYTRTLEHARDELREALEIAECMYKQDRDNYQCATTAAIKVENKLKAENAALRDALRVRIKGGACPVCWFRLDHTITEHHAETCRHYATEKGVLE